MKPRRSTAPALAILWALGLAHASARADTPFDRAGDDAKARFSSVASAYKALPAYADQGTFTRSIRLSGRETSDVRPLSLKFMRPNRIALDAGEVRLMSDATTMTTVLAPTRRYFSAPAPPAPDYPAIADGPAGAILLGGPSGPPAQLLLKLVLGLEPSQALPDRATGLGTGEDRSWEGKTYPTLRVEQGDEPALLILIDPETKLIRRMEYLLDPKAPADRVPSDLGASSLSIAWTSGPITTSEIAAEGFAFKAPEGFARMKAAEAKPATEAPKNAMIGRVAPDFALKVLDGPGKTKTVTRADLAGKVVVIDFWATWCPPCLLELPEIQKLADSYAKAGRKDVVILAVSQDREPDDGSSSRKLVESLLETKGWSLAKGPIARVALDPDQSAGDAFKVQALPTVVVLDAKGTVQSVHVGYSEEIRERLAAEVDALLDGKALAPAKVDAPEVPKSR